MFSFFFSFLNYQDIYIVPKKISTLYSHKDILRFYFHASTFCWHQENKNYNKYFQHRARPRGTHRWLHYTGTPVSAPSADQPNLVPRIRLPEAFFFHLKCGPTTPDGVALKDSSSLSDLLSYFNTNNS